MKIKFFNSCTDPRLKKSRVVDPDTEPDRIRIQSGLWIRIRIRIRIRIQEGKKDPQK
jgi:hypothetical protein